MKEMIRRFIIIKQEGSKSLIIGNLNKIVGCKSLQSMMVWLFTDDLIVIGDTFVGLVSLFISHVSRFYYFITYQEHVCIYQTITLTLLPYYVQIQYTIKLQIYPYFTHERQVVFKLFFTLQQ